LYEEVSQIYQEHLLYYSGMKVQKQYEIADEIISDMERYRGLVDILIVMDSEEYARAEAAKFNDYLKLFRHFYSPDEGMDLDREVIEEPDVDLPLDTVAQDNVNVELEQ
jgi:hypothetical protein